MIRPETIEAARKAFAASKANGSTDHKAMIAAIEAADEHRADLVRRLEFKYAKKDAA